VASVDVAAGIGEVAEALRALAVLGANAATSIPAETLNLVVQRGLAATRLAGDATV
jgi:hypothetical protein